MHRLATLATLAALLLSTPALAGGATIIVHHPENVLIPAPTPPSRDHLVIVAGAPVDTMVIVGHSSGHCVVRWTKVRIGDTTVRRIARRCH